MAILKVNFQKVYETTQKKKNKPKNKPVEKPKGSYPLPEVVEAKNEVIEKMKAEIKHLKSENLRLRISLARSQASLRCNSSRPITRKQFTHSLELLWDITGIVDRDYLIEVLIDNFTANTDYKTTINLMVDSSDYGKADYMLTQDTYELLVLVLRSEKGTDLSGLPTAFIVNRDAFFRDSQAKKANSRFGKKR